MHPKVKAYVSVGLWIDFLKQDMTLPFLCTKLIFLAKHDTGIKVSLDWNSKRKPSAGLPLLPLNSVVKSSSGKTGKIFCQHFSSFCLKRGSGIFCQRITSFLVIKRTCMLSHLGSRSVSMSLPAPNISRLQPSSAHYFRHTLLHSIFLISSLLI